MSEAPCYLDFYKTSHKDLYKPGCTESYINFTPRSGKYSNIPAKTCYVAGLQMFISKVIEGVWGDFFYSATAEEAVSQFKKLIAHGLGIEETAQHLIDLWELGYLPLEIKGLKEGTEVPYGIPHITIRNTIPGFHWLPGMLETILSCEVWPVHTSLTTAAQFYKVFKKYAQLTGAPEEFIPFQGHDFSMRGMMGVEAAKLSGVGHLMAFVGSDTCPAALAAEEHYNASLSPWSPCTTIASVPATEHSVQCSFEYNDRAYFDHCLETYPEGIISIVSDGYDFWNLVTEIIPQRKEKIYQRNGKVVIRPDSGDPVQILCGLEMNPRQYSSSSQNGTTFEAAKEETFHLGIYEGFYYNGVGYQFEGKSFRCFPVPDYKIKGLVEYLYGEFGGSKTEKGFKVLNEKIGCIYGDSITLERQEAILRRLANKGFASSNVVLGIGSYTYQMVTRDTHSSAVKATSMVINGSRVAIYKDPKTDPGKRSAKGLLYVQLKDGKYVVEEDVNEALEQSSSNLLQVVWKDGEWKRKESLDTIRQRVRNNL